MKPVPWTLVYDAAEVKDAFHAPALLKPDHPERTKPTKSGVVVPGVKGCTSREIDKTGIGRMLAHSPKYKAFIYSFNGRHSETGVNRSI